MMRKQRVSDTARGVLSTTFLVTVMMGTAAWTSVTAGGFSLKDRPGDIVEVRYDGKPVAKYVHVFDNTRREETYKPFLHIIDPERRAAITKGPGGLYSHHRGIFVGWSDLTTEGQEYDFWHMSGGSQIHQRFVEKEAGKEEASLVSRVDWITKEGKTVVEETRRMGFHALESPGIVAVDLQTRLSATDSRVELKGDPEHAGVQYRPANDIQKEYTTYIFPRPEADPKEDKDYRWVVEEYRVDDHDYTVAHLNHPSNPKGTIYSAYRDYGRFGAFLEEGVDAGETLELNYRILIWKGEAPSKQVIEDHWKAYADHEK